MALRSALLNTFNRSNASGDAAFSQEHARSLRGRAQELPPPTFGELCLRDLTPLSVQKYFSNMAMSPLAHESEDKIRDVLSSVLASAVKYEFLVRNPVENVRMPSRKKRQKTKQALPHSPAI